MASRGASANRSTPPRKKRYRSAADRDDFATVIKAARTAQIVRAFQLAAIRAFLIRLNRQRIMAAAHVALGGGGFSLWNGHLGTCLCLVGQLM